MHMKPLAKCRIFYLEDDYLLAEDTSDILRKAGALVTLCARVPRARDLVRDCDFDAALLDLNLAGNSSVPVARDLRQAQIPVVFLTGYSREILPHDLQPLPMLNKPANGPQVVRELEQQLQLSGAHDGHRGCDASADDDDGTMD